MSRKRIGELLVEAGVLAAGSLRAALGEQRKWGGPLGRHLVDMGFVTEDALVEALSRQLGLPAVDLDAANISPEVLSLVAVDLAERSAVIPFRQEGRFLDVAMSDPTNLGVVDELRIRTQLNVRPYLAGPNAIERALARHYGRGSYGVALAAEEPLELDLTPSSMARSSAAGQGTPAPEGGESDQSREIRALQRRLSDLEALVARDEDVLRKLLALLVEKGLATREEVLERIK
jgi:type IV pilus assembly protein PilB